MVIHTNPSGKKEAVVISCLTTEVVKVVEPIKFYEATRAYIIVHDTRGEGSDNASFYMSIIDESRDQIESLQRTTVKIVTTDILDYRAVLKTIISIISAERAISEISTIYLNISSGTTEFAAGAMVAATQDEDIIAFSVKAKGSNLDLEQVIKTCTVEGRSVGTTKDVCDPIKVLTFGSVAPNDRHVACLEILKAQEKENYLNFNEIIDALKTKGVWDYVPEVKRTRTDDSQKERMFFRRNYITPMLDKGWVVENHKKRNKFDLTSKGEAIVSVYGKE